jgi:ATP-dependent exoDNAse (exonuclease V) beta subunit
MLSDQSAREQAIVPNESFIVQAPAGSGKTELLTQRILSLLAFNALTPESVLAITFTKKAAHEMRMRVIKALQLGRDPNRPSTPHQIKTWELARQVLAQDAIRSWDLLNNPQRLQIMTIDALCASLVRQMPVVSEMGGMPAITDDSHALYEQAAKITLTELLDSEDPALQSLILHLDNRQQDAVDLLASMLAKREQWLPLILHHAEESELRALLEGNLAEVLENALKQVASLWEAQPWSALRELILFALEHADPGQLPAELPAVLDWSWPLPWDESSVLGWKALYQFLFTTSGTVRKTPDKRTGFPATQEAKEPKARMKAWLESMAEYEALIEACQVLPQLPDPAYPEAQWQILMALFQVLPHACAQLQLQLQTRSEIDFSGVAQAALLALGDPEDPTSLTLKLDYQLQHILVDEFQDTSLLQYALLEKLVAGWLPSDGRTLFLVGDPMQSIYRFRQAEVGLFLRVQAQGLGGIPMTPLHLRANFRSDPTIIDWINAQAPAFFAHQDDMHWGAIRYSSSDPARAAEPQCGVEVHATGELLPCIQGLLQDERLQSIAILVRARSHVKEIAQALKAAQIPYQAVDLEHLAVAPLVQDLMALTRALVHLADHAAWLAVLRAPFIGFSLEDITRIRLTDPTACVWENGLSVDRASLSLEGQAIWARVEPVIRACLDQRMVFSLAQTVKTLWFSLGGPACLPQEEDLRLAESFFHVLSQHERGGTLPDQHSLERQLHFAYVKSTLGQCRVQIMTLHKAKGLEFDAVLLPELQRSPHRHDQSLLLWEQLPTESGQALLLAPVHPTLGEKDPLYHFLKFTQKQKEAHELGRLLYVGMTRAKRQLHLFARLSQNEAGEIKPPPKGTLLSLLWPRLAEDFTMIYEPSSGEALNDSSPEKILTLRIAPDWTWPQALDAPQFLVHQPKNESNQVPVHEYSVAQHQLRQQGVLLHRMLYKVAVQGLAHWDTLSLPALAPGLLAQMRELGVSQGAEQGVERLLETLQRVLADPRGRWILQEHPQAEAEAVYGAAIIDRTFVDASGTRWVIDYKNAHPQEQSLSAFYHSQFEQYRSQLAKYAQIFADLGEKNIRTALYFPTCSGWYETEGLLL